MKVVIINYGSGNIKSIEFAFNRLGVKPYLSNNIDEILAADRVIFPGVGEASSAKHALVKSGLDSLIPGLKQPVLGICLGMQLLCNYTEEGDTMGLGVFNTSVKRFSNKVKVPQMGWNTVENLNSELFESINEGSFFYGVHSYYAEDSGVTIANSNYDKTYASALNFKNFYGVQFHPEKSGQQGSQLLNNFLNIEK
ncbi:MAG: imidazole glycerol phosphate synthase subunit HisH [Bacteroidetes bacterium MedPE-SWsnd-G2]|nr:MAG: imidazole glycerol phosphate synthase subunit HisH [Bacteroidetes bacterium MedPE-SWsnd-G2]